MPTVDESIIEQQWAQLTDTERAFERLSTSDLYCKKIMIDLFRSELRRYDADTNRREEMKLNPMRKT